MFSHVALFYYRLICDNKGLFLNFISQSTARDKKKPIN